MGAKSYTGHYPEHGNLTFIKSSYQNQPNVVLHSTETSAISKPDASGVDNLVSHKENWNPKAINEETFLE